jgi:hypothetical protein
MTREEAIEQLNFMIETIPKAPPTECDYIEEWLDTDKDIRNALDMAIEALEQELCEDAISRENLLLWLDDTKESARKHVGFLLDVQRYIRSMPPVIPQPKTGRWIHDGSQWRNRFICSECEYKVALGKINYCPNCGAKMVEPQESEDSK